MYRSDFEFIANGEPAKEGCCQAVEKGVLFEAAMDSWKLDLGCCWAVDAGDSVCRDVRSQDGTADRTWAA